MIKDIAINKPEPIAIDENIRLFKLGTDVRTTIKGLEAGISVVSTAFDNNGIT